MARTEGSSRALKVVIVVAAMALVGAGLYGLRNYRKKEAVKKALASGLAAYEAREYTKAAGDLGRYLAGNAQDIPVLLKYANAQMNRRPQSRGSVQQAIAALDRILRRQPGHPEAADKLVTLLLEARQAAEAERVAQDWVKTAPGDVNARRQLATACWSSGKRQKAVETLDGLAKERPDDVKTAIMRVSVLLAGEAPATTSAPTTGPESPGSIEAKLRKWALCTKILDETVAQAPANPASRIARASHLLRFAAIQNELNDLKQSMELRRRADEDVSEAIKAQPTDWENLVQLGCLCLELGRVDESSTQFGRAETLAPNEADIYLVRCSLAIDLNDADGGATVLDRALKLPLGERRFDLLLPAVELYSMAKRPKEARARLEELRTPDTPAEILRYLEGVVAFADNRMADATSKLEEAIKLAPDDPRLIRAYLWLGRAYAAGGTPRRAVSPYKEYVRRSASASRLAATGQLELARLYAELGRWDDAARSSFDARRSPFAARSAILRTFQMRSLVARPGGSRPDPKQIDTIYKAVSEMNAAAPKDVDVLVLQARLTYYKGDLDQAIKLLKSAREQLGEKASTTRAIVSIFVEAGKYKEAIDECTAALASADKEQIASFQAVLAETYAQQGDQEMARKTFTAAAEQATGPDRTMIRSQMADWLVRQKHPEEARQLLARIAQDEPGNVAVLIKLLALKPDAKEYAAIVDQLKKAEGESGLNWRYWQAVNWIDAADWQQHRKDIEADLGECLSKDPEYTEAAIALGLMYEKADESERALDLYRKSFALAPTNEDLAMRILRTASKLERWTEVDQTLANLPKEITGNPDLERFVQQLRVQQAIRRGDAGAAVALLEEQVKDPKNYAARLRLATILGYSPEGTERARKLLAEAAAIAPETPELLETQVQFHILHSEFKEALELCGQAIARQPTVSNLRLRSRVHETQGDLAVAAADLKQMAGLDGKSEEGYLAMGRMYFRHGQIEQAIESWEAGAKLMPGSYLLRGAVAEARLGSQDKAEQEKGRLLLDQMLSEKPEDEQLLLMRVELQLATNDLSQLNACQSICNQVLARNPKSAQGFRLLARIALLQERQAKTAGDLNQAQKEHGRALDYLERGLNANPQAFGLLLMQSELLLEESPGRAAVVARRAVELQPDNERAVVTLARSLLEAKQADEAIKALTRFLKQPEAKAAFAARLALADARVAAGDLAAAEASLTEADALVGSDTSREAALIYGRIRLLNAQKQWDRLIALARERISKYPEDDALRGMAASALLHSGDRGREKSGVEFLVELAKRHRDDPQSYSQLGLGYYQIGQFQEAAAAFQEGLKLDSGNLRLTNDLAWLICEEQKKPEDAAKVIAGAIERIQKGSEDPVAGSLWDTWGVIQYRVGNLDKSREALERCLALGPTLAEPTKQSATFHLARTLSTTDKVRSVQLLKELLAIREERLTLSTAERDEATALLDRLK